MSTTPTIGRAYSLLTVKELDTERRIISGTATTPEPDRLGDIVEPMGIKFKNPTPLLWQHRSSEPVGTVTFKKPTEEGMEFEARLPTVEEPGNLKDRIDEAWQSIKLGLVRAVSIGFRAIEMSFMDDGGVRFLRSEVLELSLVTIPANASATIATIKSIDAELLAASGQEQPGLPAASGQTAKPPGDTGKVKLITPKEAKMAKTVAEQISAFEATRAAKAARMNELMTKAAEDGSTLAEAESEEYDTLEAEVKKIDEHLVRLRGLEEQNKKAALPIDSPSSPQAQSRLASNGGGRVISVRSNAPPTSGFIRLCLAMMAGKGSREEAYQYAKRRVDWHSSTPEVVSVLENDDIMYLMRSGQLPYHQRAAVPAGQATDSVWAGPLVYAENLTSAFAEFLRPLTIIGRFNTLRRVPFNIRVPRVTAGTTGNWVGETAPKPLTSMALDTVTLTWAKAAAIVVLSEELVRFSNPAAEDMVRTDLARSITQFLDRQFVDPSVSAVTNVSPASITNGITPITATGITMAAFRADVRTLFAALLSVNQSLAGGHWIMTQQQALALSIAQNSLGQTIYPTINAEQGGTLLGYPVIASENIPSTGGSPADGYPLIFAIGPEILLADDGVVTVDASREASVQMDSAPDSPPTSSTNMLSLWQLNLLGLRAERWATWVRRRSSAVAWIQNAKYAE
jgi:HK97 family phage major capsid protein/HK97 family phage prohead protease